MNREDSPEVSNFLDLLTRRRAQTRRQLILTYCTRRRSCVRGEQAVGKRLLAQLEAGKDAEAQNTLDEISKMPREDIDAAVTVQVRSTDLWRNLGRGIPRFILHALHKLKALCRSRRRHTCARFTWLRNAEMPGLWAASSASSLTSMW